MFLLQGTTFPDSAEALATQLAEAVEKSLHLRDAREKIQVRGEHWPEAEGVTIDLTGGRVDLDEPPPQSTIAQERRPGPIVGDLQVIARPLKFGDATLRLELQASGARFDFGRDQKHRPVVSLVDAAHGTFQVQTTRNDLESMIRTGAAHAAAPHGVTIEAVKLDLRGDSPRHVHGTAHITARKGSGLLSARTTLKLTGQVHFDDNLHARVSDLNVHGSGLIGGIASAVLRPHLHNLESHTFTPSALSLDELRLHDVAIAVGPEVTLSAKFGQ